MKSFLVVLIAFLGISVSVFGQNKERKEANFGRITQADYELKVYDKDTTAAAVVLFEKGRNTFELIGNYIRLVKVVHKRIKVFDVNRYEGIDVRIPYYRTKKTSEKVIDIKAVTHNGMVKKYIDEKVIYDIDLSEKWSEKRFTFPDVQDGSIIEYTYRIESPFFFNFGNWEFQENIPKLYSEFSADIPGNYLYNRSIAGLKKLDIEESIIEKDCFEISGVGTADCDSSVYAMYDVPAFVEEPYMLAKENYISRLSYQLTESIRFNGDRKKYAKTWEDVENEFSKEKDMGRQLKYASYFQKVIPQEIFDIPNKKEKATAIYRFIRDHYTWNGDYRIFSDIRVKDAYENGKGNVAEINLSLINALKAAGIEVQLALSSTRTLKIPSSVFPVLTEYNYVLAYVKIDGKTYLLDATDKLLSFGVLPFKVFNTKARVMDFENGSYWLPIRSQTRNVNYVEVKASINEDLEIEGNIKNTYSGQLGYSKRQLIRDEGGKEIHQESADFELYNEVVENLDDVKKPLIINHSFVSDVEARGDALYVYPFLLNTNFKETTFKSETRVYPVDFGYTKDITYAMTFTVSDGYQILGVPKNKHFILPNAAGECKVFFDVSGNKVSCRFRYQLKKTSFSISEYNILKSFYEEIVSLQENSIIKIGKI